MKQAQDTESNTEPISIVLQEPSESISIKPSIAESERFIQFLNKRFDLGVRQDLLILIHETHPSTRGFYRGRGCAKMWVKNESGESESLNTDKIKSITLSSHELAHEPYQVLAHELAHYINDVIIKISDCSNSQYHNKHFKKQAERLLLEVERIRGYGYALTRESQAFKEMLAEFEPSPNAFKVFQETKEPKTKKPSRLLKWVCGCGNIVRASKTNSEGLPTRLNCLYCETEYREVGK